MKSLLPFNSRYPRQIFLLVSGLLVLMVLANQAAAKKELPSDSSHKGIVQFDPYEVFPENRVGNAVYQDRKIILTEPDKAITHILPLPEPGRFIYVTQDEAGKLGLGVYTLNNEPQPRVTNVGSNIFFAVMVLNNVVYKKVYRITQNNTVADMLASSKTADGVTAGKVGVLFYHVASIIRGGRTGDGQDEFNLRLHLVLFEEERLRHLDYPVVNTLPSLKLAWEDETSASFTLADGRKEVLSIAQFQ